MFWWNKRFNILLIVLFISIWDFIHYADYFMYKGQKGVELKYIYIYNNKKKDCQVCIKRNVMKVEPMPKEEESPKNLECFKQYSKSLNKFALITLTISLFHLEYTTPVSDCLWPSSISHVCRLESEGNGSLFCFYRRASIWFLLPCKIEFDRVCPIPPWMW